jgi:hypothetical protein
MRITFRFLWILTALSAASAPQVCSVEFTVLNRWGRFHDYRVLHFRKSSDSPDLATSFRGLVAARVPYGSYDYELGPAPGDSSVERISGSVNVNRDQVHVTGLLGTTDSIGYRPGLPAFGTIEPRPQRREPVWVILENVYGGYREESVVDERGGFRFNRIKGNNVIIVCAGSEVLMSALLIVGPQEIVNYVHVDLRTGKIKTGRR